MTLNDPICSFYDVLSKTVKAIKYRTNEVGIVEKLIVSSPTIIQIVIRHDRSPVIGDKFASRHG